MFITIQFPKRHNVYHVPKLNVCQVFRNSPFTIQRGDRIAQAVLSRVYRANFIVSDELSETIRSDKGFGSTGI